MSQSKRTKLINSSLWALVFLWLVLIFAFSAQSAEHSDFYSKKVTEIIIKIISLIDNVTIDANRTNSLIIQLHSLVRKFAHGWIYFVLGVLVVKAVIKTGVMGFRAHVLAVLFCGAYAVTDEIHQLFVPGRSGQISDILIDTSGAILGMGVYWLFHFVNRHIKN